MELNRDIMLTIFEEFRKNPPIDKLRSSIEKGLWTRGSCSEFVETGKYRP